MTNRKLFRCCSALFAIVLAGCGATRPSKYYELTVAGKAPPPANAEPFPVTLLIGPITSSHLYREDRIVYSAKDESMGTYEFHRWVQPPTEMLQDVVLRELRSSGRFRAVALLRSNSQGDYVLRGRLYDFKEVSGKPASGRVAVDFELRELKTGATVWSHSYLREEAVSGDSKQLSELVAALDRGTQEIVSELQEGLSQYFATRPAAR
ncbi:MAG TPA: ABC-type transport auxiliary lipoprotein family protein [Candidatus Acidoferrales bacterium]|nr:ABC-type transport auxiliary lipoprotein family protein [Candidatus Acidoferrales bacterium]